MVQLQLPLSFLEDIWYKAVPYFRAVLLIFRISNEMTLFSNRAYKIYYGPYSHVGSGRQAEDRKHGNPPCKVFGNVCRMPDKCIWSFGYNTAVCKVGGFGS
jgi:hypothetical protein